MRAKPAAKNARSAARTTEAAKKSYPSFYKYARSNARSAREAGRETGSKAGRDAPANELQAASTGPEARTALRRFLKKYTPANEEYQDGFDRNRIRAARFELMRLEYLHGHVAAGDKLLALLQDVDSV
jgi:hypothetical protein